MVRIKTRLTISDEPEKTAKNNFVLKDSGIMAKISYVSKTRHKKEINYEQCETLLLLIMELFEKN